MRQISKTYGELRANEGIDFQVLPGTIHAIAGENGAGKSTLMKILFGLVDSDPGSGGIFIQGNRVQFRSPLDAIERGIGMVQQHFALAGPLSALDNVILGSEPRRAGFVLRDDARKLLEKIAGVHLQVPWRDDVENLPVGMQQRVEILKLLFRKAEILILDEPTAVLTPQEVDTFFSLLRALKSQGKSIILITHKLHEILSLCDEVTVLRNGKVTGHFSTRGLTREQLIVAMIGRSINPVTKKKSDRTNGEILVDVRGLVARPGGRGAVKGIDLCIHRGEIVGIAGMEGNGQQALVEALLGLEKFDGQIFFKSEALFHKGTSVARKKLNFGLISEDRQEQSLWVDATVTENCAIGLTHKFRGKIFLNKSEMVSHARDVLEGYNVKMGSLDTAIKSLSGGNQQKVVIAREVGARQPEFLIASQPTRGVDVGAIEFIHQQILNLQEKGSGILLISSELEELCALSDRILVLSEGRIAAEFRGPPYDVHLIGKAMTEGARE